MLKNSRSFVRPLRLCLALLAFAFTSSAFADTLYFQLKINHAPIPLPYGQSFNTITWTMDENPLPTSPYTPGDPWVRYEILPGLVGVDGGGAPFSQDKLSFNLSQYASPDFDISWETNGYYSDIALTGITDFYSGLIYEPTMLPGIYTMARGHFLVYTPGFGGYDPNFPDELQVDTTGDTLTISREPIINTPSVPEPSTFMLMGSGMVAAVGSLRKKLARS